MATKLTHSERIQNEYAEWLGTFEWDYWCTLTTRYKLTMPSARRAVEGLHKELKKAGECLVFFAIEPYDLKEGYHIHALLKVPKGYKYPHIIQVWQHVSGNKRKGEKVEVPDWETFTTKTQSTWNRTTLENYDKQRGAKGYVGKYINKDRSDYDFLA